MPFYLGKHIKQINKKAKEIKPPSEFTHSIRPLETISYWKASEYRSWLLHPLLKALLPSEYVNHLALLVCAMYILLSDCITPADLSTADRMLNTFYQLLPELYPEEMCKPNAHSLIHICPFVNPLGPIAPIVAYTKWRSRLKAHTRYYVFAMPKLLEGRSQRYSPWSFGM